jgi:hypothetical protein
MTYDEKKNFIRTLLKQTEEALLNKLDFVPEAWDGHELRALIADEVAEQIGSVSIIRRDPRGKRAREYRNTLAVQNL